mmetsp:Transcript_50307/g.79681  ORF Transcript_50307/g.79681 Transcript_50307/m.79681 type:complete len:166 (-) Transcript_50307:140-637(-)
MPAMTAARGILSEVVLKDLGEPCSEDRDSLCEKWLEKFAEAISELQDSLVDINYSFMDEPLAARKGVPGRLQAILNKSQELVGAMQIVVSADPQGRRAKSSQYAGLVLELDDCRNEAVRLLGIFCQPGTRQDPFESFDALVAYMRGLVPSRTSCVGMTCTPKQPT